MRNKALLSCQAWRGERVVFERLPGGRLRIPGALLKHRKDTRNGRDRRGRLRENLNVARLRSPADEGCRGPREHRFLQTIG